MKKMNVLNQKSYQDLGDELWSTQIAIKGLGALIRDLSPDACLSKEELFGVGQNLLKLCEELTEPIERLCDAEEVEGEPSRP